MSASLSIAQRAAELRAAFDRSFAEAAHTDTTRRVDFLAVTVGPDRYAIRLAEICGLFADKKITPVAGSVPSLLGIAGFRAAVVPVFDLRLLLGYSSPRPPRWLVITAATPVALAFDAFDGHLRLAPDAIVPQTAGDGSRALVRHTARAHDGVRPIVEIPAVVQQIKAHRAGSG